MNFVEETLLELEANYGWTQAQIERSLDLKQQGLNDSENPGIIALMKMIKTFPWLVKIADRNFDENYAKKTLYQVASDIYANEAHKLGTEEKKKNKSEEEEKEF